MLKKSPIESIIDFLAQLSGKQAEGRRLSFLPFAPIEKEKSLGETGACNLKGRAGIQSSNETEGTTISIEKLSELVDKDGSGTTRESHSKINLARKDVNDDFVAFKWLQDLGNSSCSKTVQDLLEDLSQLMSNRIFACRQG